MNIKKGKTISKSNQKDNYYIRNLSRFKQKNVIQE